MIARNLPQDMIALGSGRVAVCLGTTFVLSLAADPVFGRVGIAEVLLVLSLITLVGLVAVDLPHRFAVQPEVRQLLVAISIYLGSVCLSFLYGVLTGVPVASAARSSAPYLIAALALPIVLIPRLKAEWIVIPMLAAGAAQVVYVIWLFQSSGADLNSRLYVLLHRVTLLDARTTLPLFVAATVLPGLAFSLRAPNWIRASAVLIWVACVIAGFVTLTRTHVLVVALCFSGLAGLALLVWSGKTWPEDARARAFKLIVATLIVPVVAVLFLLTQPGLKLLPGLLLLRTEVELQATPGEVERSKERALGLLAQLEEAQKRGVEPSSPLLRQLIELSSGKQRPAGGRFEDEWLPAWQHYLKGNLLEKAIGIGAGRPFVTGSGEPRTYIHNFPLYVLLYQGALGLAAWIGLGALVALRLFSRFLCFRDWVAGAMLIIWLSLQFYALMFAVHKLVSFNLLMLAIYLTALGCLHPLCQLDGGRDELADPGLGAKS